MKSLIFTAILFLFPFYAQAGFPEGENGYDLKKIEESFRLPCDEIGNDDCIARALGNAKAASSGSSRRFKIIQKSSG